jgi:hypothetical protein
MDFARVSWVVVVSGAEGREVGRILRALALEYRVLLDLDVVE